MLLSISLAHGIYRYKTFINSPDLITLTHTDFPKCHSGRSGMCMVLWHLFVQLAQIFCLPNRTLTCKPKLNGCTAVEQHKLLHFNCLLLRKWHNIMKCLDSGHDSSLLCGSVLKSRYQTSETRSRYLLKRLAATVLGQHCFQGQFFRCLWVHRAQRIAQAPPVPADSFYAHVS